MKFDHDMIAMHFGFLRDGCAAMAGNITGLLIMAGERVTARSVMLVVKSIPIHYDQIMDPIWRESFLGKILKRAFDNRDQDPYRDQYQRLADYFLHDIPRRSSMTRDLLEAAFEGVMSIEFEQGPGFEIIPDGPAIRFPCEGCGKVFSVRPELAGKKAKCKACDAIMTIPEATA